MDKDDVIDRLAVILADQQGVSVQIKADHRICRDLGVCGGDFQDFMISVWHKYNFLVIEPVRLHIEEGAITVDDIAEMIVNRHSTAE